MIVAITSLHNHSSISLLYPWLGLPLVTYHGNNAISSHNVIALIAGWVRS